MSAYVIADITVNNLERYEDYKKLAPPVIAAYGGKYMARGGKADDCSGRFVSSRCLTLSQFEALYFARLCFWQ